MLVIQSTDGDRWAWIRGLEKCCSCCVQPFDLTADIIICCKCGGYFHAPDPMTGPRGKRTGPCKGESYNGRWGCRACSATD